MGVECIGEVEFDAVALWQQHPPLFTNERKRELIARITAPITGTLHVSRWQGALPETAEPKGEPRFELVGHAFDYPPEEDRTVGWHLNFAHSELFIAYPGALLAQDELQVLEHPILGSLAEALARREDEPRPRTRDRSGAPTPVLVRGAKRSLALDTSGGLYGNAFARADPGRIAEATTFLDPPTTTNILAMEAPPGGRGAYDRGTIEDVLLTAYVGFAACRGASAPERAVVHTGGWGTGAYGGDRVLMALLQVCAARLAGLDRLIYHNMADDQPLDAALTLLDELPWGQSVPVTDLVGAIHAHGFVWGVSDGN
jgi:hypothetical protein